MHSRVQLKMTIRLWSCSDTMTQSYEKILNMASVGCICFMAFVIAALSSCQWTLCKACFLGVTSIVTILTALASQYLRQMRPCDSLGWRGFFQLALLKLFSATLARYSVWSLKRTYRSRSAMRARQQATLMGFVSHSKSTMFGRDHGFEEVQGIEDFRDRVPVRDYAELDKYNQLVFQGEANVFFPGAIEFLFKTSGTTGKNKTFAGAMRYVKSLTMAYMTTQYCLEQFTRNSGRKSSMARQLMTTVNPVDRKNEFGVPVGPLSKFFQPPGDMFATPNELSRRIHDAKTAFYIHAVFALWHERIGDVNVFFPTSLITFMRSVSANWDSVLGDIEKGRLSEDKVNVDTELLRLFNQRISPKPERATQLRALFGDGKDLSNFFQKAWPDIPCIMLARSGSFQSSYRYLRKYLGNVPTFGPMLGGSEGFVGINMTVSDVDYSSPERYHPMLAPSFVEFVPVDSNGSDIGEAMLAHELEVGGLYETVLTSYNCFRLRSGDVIRVVAMDQCAPVFEISHRKSHVLSVHVEKTTEKSLQACVLLTAERLNYRVVDFSAADCFLYETVTGVSYGTKYYVLFVELDGDGRLTDDDKKIFDMALRESSENYDLFRGEGHIDAMQVLQVETAAFAILRQQMMRQNMDISEVQFKMPRVLRADEQVRCLMERCL